MPLFLRLKPALLAAIRKRNTNAIGTPPSRRITQTAQRAAVHADIRPTPLQGRGTWLTKDALLVCLEALKESSDVFPPLKSARWAG
jgi:hypothetical protein